MPKPCHLEKVSPLQSVCKMEEKKRKKIEYPSQYTFVTRIEKTNLRDPYQQNIHICVCIVDSSRHQVNRLR